MLLKSLALAAVGFVAVGPATAQSAAQSAEDLAKSKNCLACHQVDRKLVGPSYKEIAAKYAGQKDAVGKLSSKVRAGGVGVWGQVPMPANPQVTEKEAETLVKWILSLK